MADYSKFPDGSLVLVSRQCIGPSRMPVWFAYRTPQTNPQDSGWVFHGANEPQGYADDPANFLVCSLAMFLEEDPTLIEIISNPIGTTWERYSNKGKWIEVTDSFGSDA